MKTPFWKLTTLAALPIAAALAMGMWLSSEIHKGSQADTQRLRTEEVVAQDRLLVDAIWSAIETIKTRALSLDLIRKTQLKSGAPGSSPEGVILHWAELETHEGTILAVRQSARNPAWKPEVGLSGSWETFEQFYLQSVMQKLNLRELPENGVAVLRLKQDPHRNQEWLALAFAGSDSSSVILALVDPGEVFPIFKRWAQRSEGGSLRGYLVASDGFVLAHSQPSYVASDFSRTQVFTAGLRDMLQGRVISGAGVFKGIDEMSVTVAYSRPGSLPIAAVVERIAAAPVVLAQTPLVFIESFLFLLTFSLFSALGMKRFMLEPLAPGPAPVQPLLWSDRVKIAQFETQTQRTQDARLEKIIRASGPAYEKRHEVQSGGHENV